LKNALSLAGGLILILIALVVTPALAQPSYAQPPAYAQPPSYAVKGETVHGRIVSFDGHYALTVRDDRGYDDRITLHDGTVINPTGLRLAPGMSVTVVGEPRGSALLAYEIDTRYHEDSGYQAYPYAAEPSYYYAPDYPVYYPSYPVYYPYPCCYGPYYSLGIGIHFGGHGRHR
jgi:hypothetical protein